MRELLDTIDAWFETSDVVALATVVSTWGSTPRPAGSHMVVDASGRMAGSVSGGCVEGAVVEAALAILDNAAPQMLEFGVADELAWDVGLACGGRISVWVEPLRNDETYRTLRHDLLDRRAATVCTVVDGPLAGRKLLLRQDGALLGDLGALQPVAIAEAGPIIKGGRAELIKAEGAHLFVQPYLPPRRLIVIGAVHTAIPLVTLAKTVGYEVTVVDARSAFATRDRFPHADELLVEWPDTALDQLRPDASTAVVVLTHDSKFDEPALTTALRTQADYIGAIGSRTTSQERLLRLRSLGLTTEDLERIHGPIGLDIGAVTPEETALSILAEIVAVRRGRPGSSLSQTTFGRATRREACG